MIPSPLRTIQVVNVRWFNATAWYGLKLASLLKASGHESLVIALQGTDTFRKAQDMGLQPISLPLNTTNPLHFPKLLHSMRQIIRDFRPHVVNCHRGESFLFWGMLKSAGRYALIRTRGDQRLPKNNLPNRILHTNIADAVIATNTRMHRYFLDTMHVSPERAFTVFGGVDTRRFQFDQQQRETVRARWGVRPDHCVIGVLGRFDLVKGQRELLTAVAPLIREGLPIRLVLAGFPTAISQEEVEQWIQETGMGPYTIITGKIDNVPACLSALDIGVVSSLWSETIARAALEIMACSRPLISTSVGVMPDLLPSEALVEPGDIPALTRLIRQAVTDTAFRSALTEASISRIQTLRDEDFLAQTLQIYTSAYSAFL